VNGVAELHANGGLQSAILVALCELRGTEPRLRGSMWVRTPWVAGISDIDQTLPEDDLRFLTAE
jgi:hypothetical protein